MTTSTSNSIIPDSTKDAAARVMMGIMKGVHAPFAEEIDYYGLSGEFYVIDDTSDCLFSQYGEAMKDALILRHADPFDVRSRYAAYCAEIQEHNDVVEAYGASPPFAASLFSMAPHTYDVFRDNEIAAEGSKAKSLELQIQEAFQAVHTLNMMARKFSEIHECTVLKVAQKITGEER